MAWYDIFDSSGNKIGSVSDGGSPGEGPGCFFSVLIGSIVIMGSVLVWPGLLASSTTETLPYALTVILLVLATTVGSIVHSAKKQNQSFMFTWIASIGKITVIAGLSIWLIMGSYDNTFSFGSLLASFFIAFLMSIGSGLVVAIVVAIIRATKNRK